MLSFAVYSNGKPATKVNLEGAYVVGTDDVPLRAELSFADGVVRCTKRAAGPAGLALLWEVKSVGIILLETVRVQEREEPYILQVELARSRLLRITHKVEDWGMLDHDEAADLLKNVDQARDLLIEALQADAPAKAASLGDEALSIAVEASEQLSRLHAQVFLNRRAQSGALGRRLFGCTVHSDPPTEASRKRLSDAFDFATLPIVWRDVEPSEQEFNWKPLDAWVEALSKSNTPIRGSTLLSFGEKNVPDWLYIWEHDFDTIRDLAFEHVRRVINRYGQYIQIWTVISGIHANNCFAFSFEQLMELTRMTAAVTKQIAPRGQAVLEIVTPWGEYYARNQRTIPPLLYADMAIQSGVNFDAFGLRFHFGSAAEGSCVRDMFQISSLLDQFVKLGKPLHVTAVQVPSESPEGKRPDGEGAAAYGGMWHEPWSEKIQSEWLRRFIEIALSKTGVESVSWNNLADYDQQEVPYGGLLRSDLVPKAAFKELLAIRKELLASEAKGRPAAE